MKKKIMSLALALVMCLGLCVPVFAADTDNEEFFAIQGETTTLYYYSDEDCVDVGEDVVARQGNDIFLNGSKIATINTTVDFVPDTIEPRTGWVYGGNVCPAGYSPSDYNNLYSTKNHNITFEKAIAECGRDVILSVLILIVPFVGSTTGKEVFQVAASAILGNLSALTNENCVYARERIYSGGMPYTHKNIFQFYGDKSYSSSTYIETTTCYSGWA